jgi:hypothetical protein
MMEIPAKTERRTAEPIRSEAANEERSAPKPSVCRGGWRISFGVGSHRFPLGSCSGPRYSLCIAPSMFPQHHYRCLRRPRSSRYGGPGTYGAHGHPVHDRPVRTICVYPEETPYFILLAAFVVLLSWFDPIRESKQAGPVSLPQEPTVRSKARTERRIPSESNMPPGSPGRTSRGSRTES